MEHLSIITEQIRRLDEVVQGFLRFIRPEDLKLQPVSLPALVDAIMPVVAAEAAKHGVDVAVDVPGDLPVINVDAGVLQQALLNLALNGCQAMPQGGRLKISAAAVRGRRVEVLCEDNGVGIAPESQAKIFDEFAQEDASTTRRFGGTGLGLAISRQLIELMGGRLEVSSTPGKGSIFSFELSLPLADPSSKMPAAPRSLNGIRVLVVHENAAARILLGKTLRAWTARPTEVASLAEALSASTGLNYDALIVDDERIARQELRRLLAAHPEIEIAGEAQNGEQALELIPKFAPDVVFLDIQMPGLTGFELLERLEDLPQVIFTTAYD